MPTRSATSASQTTVDAAESEAGQMVLRDLILSRTLPRGAWRAPRRRDERRRQHRRHGALPAAGRTRGRAATRGAEWSWKDDPDPLHKVCALLSGLCLLLAGNDAGNDAMRKDAAFNGRVFLQFLQSSAPPRRAERLLIHVPTMTSGSSSGSMPRWGPRAAAAARGPRPRWARVLMMTQQRPQNRKRRDAEEDFVTAAPAARE